MTSNLTIVRQEIIQGIKAYKAGDDSSAWLHFQTALREDPQNVNVLLWLAYLAQSHEKRIFLLNRVLEIDPNNARAQAGLIWAEQQSSQLQNTDDDSQAPATPEEIARLHQDLRATKGTAELRAKAKKGTIAQRARRRISPLVVLLIAGSVLAGASLLGLAALSPSVSRAEQPGTISQLAAVATSTTASEPTTVVLPTNTPPPPATSTAVPTRTTIPSFLTIAPPTATAIPLVYQPQSSTEKWIEVDLSDQKVTAWEGREAVMHFTASTGLPNTPTRVGQYRIYQKYTSTRMIGPGYDLPNVPFTMYYDGSYALHGAYWHNNFGEPMSHGCVNLSPGESEALFDWAGPELPEGALQVRASINNPGTLVIVHD